MADEGYYLVAVRLVKRQLLSKGSMGCHLVEKMSRTWYIPESLNTPVRFTIVLAIRREEGVSQRMVAAGDEPTQMRFQVLQDRPNIRLKVVWRSRSYSYLGLQAKLT